APMMRSSFAAMLFMVASGLVSTSCSDGPPCPSSCRECNVRGGFCYSGSCPQADGGVATFTQCNQYQCILPEDAPAAGIAACQSSSKDHGCTVPPTNCTANYASRTDFDDCWRYGQC